MMSRISSLINPEASLRALFAKTVNNIVSTACGNAIELKPSILIGNSNQSDLF